MWWSLCLCGRASIGQSLVCCVPTCDRGGYLEWASCFGGKISYRIVLYFTTLLYLDRAAAHGPRSGPEAGCVPHHP